jgi:parallel beta-helix repeat protein
VLRNNLIIGCSDVGIYLNRAKNTQVLHNTLIATLGVDFRFATTSGQAAGNLLAGRIRNRDAATGVFAGNLENVTAQDFAGWYVDPLGADLRKKGDLTALLDKGTAPPGVSEDYCARARGNLPIELGALEHSLGDCVTTRPPLSDAPPVVGGPDGGSARWWTRSCGWWHGGGLRV